MRSHSRTLRWALPAAKNYAGVAGPHRRLLGVALGRAVLPELLVDVVAVLPAVGLGGLGLLVGLGLGLGASGSGADSSASGSDSSVSVSSVRRASGQSSSQLITNVWYDMILQNRAAS